MSKLTISNIVKMQEELHCESFENKGYEYILHFSPNHFIQPWMLSGRLVAQVDIHLSRSIENGLIVVCVDGIADSGNKRCHEGNINSATFKADMILLVKKWITCD